MVVRALVLLWLLHFTTTVSPHVLLEKSSSNDFKDDVVTIERHAGEVAKLKCNSKTAERVHWTKNGRRMACRETRCRPTLKLAHLTSDDEGVYQCWLPPGLPTNPTFALKILDAEPKVKKLESTASVKVSGPPEVDGPGNLSAPVGTAVALRCSVVSALPPNIQWLRLLTNANSADRPRKVLEYEGATYEVLAPSGVAALSNHTWITKLVIDKLNEHSAGYYVCVATNNHGFQFRGGYLTVTQKALVTAGVMGGRSEVLYIEVVLIATVFMLIATTALALLYLAHWNRRNSHTSVPTNL